MAAIPRGTVIGEVGGPIDRGRSFRKMSGLRTVV